MPKIFIVRHGENEDNANHVLGGRRDLPLTDLGRQQVAVVAEKLSDAGIQVIYSSPLSRAYESAQIIGAKLGIAKITVDDRLTERDFGVMTGQTVADIPKYCKEIIVADGVNYFLDEEIGAEAFPALYERAKNLLADLSEKHPNETMLLVAHNDIGKMLEAAYHGWSWEQALHSSLLRNGDVIVLS